MTNKPHFVGRRPVRLVALALVTASAISWTVRWPGALGVALSAAFFLAFVHTVNWIYGRWIEVANEIQLTVVTLFFSLCYLVVVPPLWLFARARDSLRLADHDEGTYWVDRREEERDLKYFQRLG